MISFVDHVETSVTFFLISSMVLGLLDQLQIFSLFLLFLVIDGLKCFWMESLHKNILLMFLKGPFMSYTFPTILYINDLPDDVICNIGIYANNTTLYSKCDQASDLW